MGTGVVAFRHFVDLNSDPLCAGVARTGQFAHGRPPINPKDRVVVIVDDGIATGATMSAAVQSLKAKGAKRVIVATPVSSRQAASALKLEGVDVRTVATPEYFGAVGNYYRNFTEVSDAEVGSIDIGELR